MGATRTVPTQEEVIPEQEDPQFSFKRQRRKQAERKIS
jgi:hypothetical protein